ncbi:MAG TPA: hypothetical protein VLG74_15655, partial [Blastocatellia bacterium]|nr:hypothetical protein [Blastocatellia bacterium]
QLTAPMVAVPDSWEAFDSSGKRRNLPRDSSPELAAEGPKECSRKLGPDFGVSTAPSSIDRSLSLDDSQRRTSHRS